MIQRVCKDLLGGKRIKVLNDEAHHCCRAKADATKVDAETRSAVKKNNDAARSWMSGLEALQRVAKVPVQLYDLSATPFYVRGCGEPEGTLFPCVVSDFSPDRRDRVRHRQSAARAGTGRAGRRPADLSARLQVHATRRAAKADHRS